MDSWSTEIIETLKSNVKGAREKDLRFFRIDELIRNIERTGEYSASCPQCNKNKISVAENVANIEEAVNVPGKKRRELDRLTSRLSTHMMKDHGFYPPYHFTYLYSFFGMVAGLVIGYLGTRLFPSESWVALIIGFTAGLLTGQIWGNKKDRKIRKDKKLM